MMEPAQKELWVVIGAAGVPIGPADGDEATACITAQSLTKSAPEFGPYRVKQYVVAERVTSTQDWYAVRWRRLDKLVREEATEEFKTRWFNVMANGTAEVTEGHVALDDLMPRVMQLQHSLSLANQAVGAMLTGFERDEETQKWRGDLVPVGGVMSALIGAMETDDGLAVVRYCGHLERLLKEQREATERFKEAAAALRPFASEHGAVLCEHAEPAAGNEIRMSHLKAAREAYRAAFPEDH